MHIDWHLAAAAPEWASVPIKKRTVWQRMAARTHGVVTPGNIVSVLGVILVLAGLFAIWFDHYWLSLLLIAVGRLCDLADGVIAHNTHTKSPVGEGVDATCDKIGALATLVVYAAAGFIWWPAAALVGIRNIISGLIGLIGRHRRYGLHPLPIGKIATVGEWLALLTFGLLAALGWSHTSTLGLVSYAVLGVSVVLATYATVWYYRLFCAARNRNKA
ncbi:MAG TPA: CDP-alcohol phosphatidyltransferase family protein [Candidatus Saccharimonadales bacterium]|nr:CDP-alcohol phosphatidyltransferase family protein [Candidatus Saccharimonadales bacterium]